MSFMVYSLADRVLINEAGEVCEITNMIDAWGEETDDLAAAVYLVAQQPDGEWITIAAGGVEQWLQ